MTTIHNFKNCFGELVLEEVGQKQPCSDVRSSKISDSDKFSLEVAEKIALISENKCIQIGVGKGECFLVWHHTSSLVSVCKVRTLEFTPHEGESPRESLNRLNKSLF